VGDDQRVPRDDAGDRLHLSADESLAKVLQMMAPDVNQLPVIHGRAERHAEPRRADYIQVRRRSWTPTETRDRVGPGGALKGSYQPKL
jgi:hypothetical protein